MTQDFHDWKRHPITIVVFNELKSRVDFLIENMIAQAATSPQTEIAEMSGAVKAIRDILNITVEEVQETEE